MLAGLLSQFFFVSGADAQRAARDSTDPGQVERRIEQSEPAPKPKDVDLPAAPEPAVPEPEAQPEFILAAVSIEGATVFDPADFAPLYADFLATGITLAQVEEILERITAMYRDAGYFLSRAVAPPQELGVGVLRIRVIEGHVEDVVILGDRRESARIEGYAHKIAAVRPLTLAALERYVLLINDLPGVAVSPSVRPLDEDNGLYELALEIEFDEIDAVAYADNRGTPSVGRLQSWLSAGINNVFGTGERLQAGYFTVPNQPDELTFLQLAYNQPIGNEGTVLSLTGSRTDIEAGDDLARFDTESSSTRLVARLSHPVIRRREQSLWLFGTFEYANLDEEQLGFTTLDDRLRVLRVGANYVLTDSLDGTTYVSLEASRGLDILGASNPGAPDLSRLDGESEFTKVNVNLTRQQALGEHFALQIALAGQKSADSLLSSEEFALGGSQFGRAYDFAEVTGEDGVAVSAELRYVQDLEESWLDSFQIYGFYDFGAVWNDVPGGGTARDSLASAGIGARLAVTPGVGLTAEVAAPLTRRIATTDDKDPRFFFSVTASF